MSQQGPGFWERVVWGNKGNPEREKVYGPGGRPGFWERVLYPHGMPQPQPTGKLNKYGYADTGESDPVQEAWARAMGNYENRNIDQEIADWSKTPGNGSSSGTPATKLSSADAISKAIAASVGDWRQPDPDNRSMWAAAGEQPPPPVEQPYQPQSPLPGGGLPWQMMTPQQAQSVMAPDEQLPGFDLRRIGVGAPYKSGELLRVPSPQGGQTFGGNTYGGGRFGGNTFGGNKFGGNTGQDVINSIINWNGKVYADGGRVDQYVGEPHRSYTNRGNYADQYMGEPRRAGPFEQMTEPRRAGPFDQYHYGEPRRAGPFDQYSAPRTRARGGRMFDEGGNVEALGNLANAFSMDKDKDKKQQQQPAKKSPPPLPSLPGAPPQPVIAPPQMAAPAQVRPIALGPTDPQPQRAARGGYFARANREADHLRTHGGPMPTIDDYKRGKGPPISPDGRQGHFAWAAMIPMAMSALSSMGGKGGGGDKAQLPELPKAPAQPQVAPPTMAAPAQQREVDFVPGDEPDPHHSAMLEQARGGRTGFMRGGYPELYNRPVRQGYFSTGGGSNYVPYDGQGDGRSDHIEALLSPGEYVMDAETTSLLGNGDNEAGARKFDKLRKSIRIHKGKQLAKGQFSPMAKKNAEEYLARDAISDGMRYVGR